MCSGSPYGDYFPADVGANETDRNLLDTTEYGLNEYQKQVRLLVNGNVHSVMFYYSNFNTELNYDFLTVEDLLGEYSYTGNLGTSGGLVVEQTAELRVAGAETQQAWKAHFFTGSAPRVVRLLASTVKDPDIVNVTFSEPVNAATPIASTLFVGGGASGKCVLRGAACLNQSQAFLTNNVDLRLDSKFTAANAAVTLPGTVSGIGRSVAAAQGLTGDAYSGGAATLAVLASDWVACGDSTTRCWTDAKVPPASP